MTTESNNSETPLSTVAFLRACTHSTLDFHRMEAIARIHGAADRIEFLERDVNNLLRLLRLARAELMFGKDGDERDRFIQSISELTSERPPALS